MAYSPFRSPTEVTSSQVATHVVRSLDLRYGGPSTSVPELAFAAGRTRRYNIQLVDFKGRDETSTVESDAQTTRIPITWNPSRLYLEPVWGGQLDVAIRDSNIVQIHGLWQPHGIVAGLLARKHRKPYLVSAHGMLDSWELRAKRWKKLPYSLLLERPNLRGAACLRALTHIEADNYRAFGLTAPIAIIPNGVNIPSDINPEHFLRDHEPLRGKRIVLFFGRLHPKKGVHILCRAWAKIHKKFDDSHLVIAGPDYENTRSRLESEIGAFNLEDSVTLLGMRKGRSKWSLLAAAHAFVLPSHSEGFSVAVLEALGCGLPVIASTHCNFPEIADRGCGWTIEPNESQLEEILAECLKMNSRQYAVMSSAGRKLVADQYTWDRIGCQMADTYDWVLGGSKPMRVEIRS